MSNQVTTFSTIGTVPNKKMRNIVIKIHYVVESYVNRSIIESEFSKVCPH